MSAVLNVFCALLATVLALVLLYFGTYFALVTREADVVVFRLNRSQTPFSSRVSYPKYTIEDASIAEFLSLAHVVDRSLFRPDYWDTADK